MCKTLRFLVALALGALPFVSINSAVASEAELWEKLAKGGLVVLMRHASTNTGKERGNPLIRDPSCAKERKLSNEGKREAAKIGEMFASKKIPVKDVLASPYCRTVETGKIAFGRAEPTGFLSLMEVMEQTEADTVTEQINRKIGSHTGNENLVMITHEPNIGAVAFDPVEMGAFVVFKPAGNDAYEELGKIYLFK